MLLCSNRGKFHTVVANGTDIVRAMPAAIRPTSCRCPAAALPAMRRLAGHLGLSERVLFT